ncbi:unannotated protein [freshwater metagenome]|uniref:Unannotated protein n=1 Tax=freshwater metagenome TaxID=449393 RepID=A0A6J7NFK4_9ZZZZ
MGEAAEPGVGQCPGRLSSAQMLVKERCHLGDVVDSGTGGARGRSGVRPWPGQQSCWCIDRRDRSKGGVAVAVSPARDDHRRDVDAVVVGTHRSVAPILVVARVREPGEEPRLMLLDATQPLLPPGVAPDPRHGWQEVHGRHVVAVVDEIEPLARPAHLVDIIGESVVGGIDGDDRLEVRWPFTCELEGIEPAIGGSEHADAAGAPRLGCQPGDHLCEVTLLSLRVLIGGDSTARAGTSNIDPGDSEAELISEAGVLRSPASRHVVLAVRECLEDAGGWLHVREKQRDRQSNPIAHLNQRLHPASPRYSTGRARCCTIAPSTAIHRSVQPTSQGNSAR